MISYSSRRIISGTLSIISMIVIGVIDIESTLLKVSLLIPWMILGIYAMSLELSTRDLTEYEIAAKKNNFQYIYWMRSNGLIPSSCVEENAIKLAITGFGDKKYETLQQLLLSGARINRIRSIEEFFWDIRNCTMDDSITLKDKNSSISILSLLLEYHEMDLKNDLLEMCKENNLEWLYESLEKKAA